MKRILFMLLGGFVGSLFGPVGGLIGAVVGCAVGGPSKKALASNNCRRCAVFARAEDLGEQKDRYRQGSRKYNDYYDRAKEQYMKAIPMRPCPNCAHRPHG